MARPSNYRKEHLKILKELMSQGSLDCQIYAALDISKATFYRWLQDHDDFREVYEKEMPKCESWWVRWGQLGMQGEIKGFNFNAWISIMNNKFKWAKGTGNDSNQVTNINTVNQININTKSPSELLEYLRDTAMEVPVIEITELEDKSKSITE